MPKTSVVFQVGSKVLPKQNPVDKVNGASGINITAPATITKTRNKQGRETVTLARGEGGTQIGEFFADDFKQA